MRIILGVDIGGSTTKIVAFQHGDQVLDRQMVRADDQLTSLYGAVGRILYENSLTLEQVAGIVLTGVGATRAEGDIYGIPTVRVKEFQAIGRGGLLLSGLDKALVVSMGTGTAFVRADGDQIVHIGGSGVGGGTLLGLSSRLMGEKDIAPVIALAEKGDLGKVDLSIGEISNVEIPSLPSHATASNFGGVKSTAGDADMALGLCNMVFQTAGMLAVFACLDTDVRDIIVTGSMATLPQARPLLNEVGILYGVKFHIPDDAAFATAIGAASLWSKEFGGFQ